MYLTRTSTAVSDQSEDVDVVLTPQKPVRQGVWVDGWVNKARDFDMRDHCASHFLSFPL